MTIGHDDTPRLLEKDEPEAAPRDVARIRADIEETRNQLGDTVEALSAKLDVKARAEDAWDTARSRMAESSGRAARLVRENRVPLLVLAGGVVAGIALLVAGRRWTGDA